MIRLTGGLRTKRSQKECVRVWYLLRTSYVIPRVRLYGPGILFGRNNLFSIYPPRLPAHLRHTPFVSVFSLIYRELAKYNSRTS